MLTAADDRVPEDLFAQLTTDGVLVAPVGKPGAQRLMRYRRIETAEKTEWIGEALDVVSFVPLLGGFV